MAGSVLCVGLCVVDLVHRVDHAPGPNEKVTALSRELIAGGPATNAALTVAALRGAVCLVTAIGSGPLATVVRLQLTADTLRLVDVAEASADFDINVSSVVVSVSGERSVVSRDGGHLDEGSVDKWRDLLSSNEIRRPDVVLLDGHYPALAEATAVWARAGGIPVVLDAGRWKPHFADLLPLVDELVCSADFAVPTGSAFVDIATAGHASGARVVAQTNGADPVQVSVDGTRTSIPVPQVEVVDTLGAGDVLHGAYALFRARGSDPVAALEQAVVVASERCRIGRVRP